MYIVESGRLRVFREDGARQLNLAWLRAGDYFGERSTLLGTVRAASVVTLTDCRLLALAPEALTRLLCDHPEFRRVIEERVSQYNADREARVPLDFTQEMLPREVEAHDKVRLPADARAESGRPARPAEEEGEEGEEARMSRNRLPATRGASASGGGGSGASRSCSRSTRWTAARRRSAMVCRHFGRQVSLAQIRQL